MDITQLPKHFDSQAAEQTWSARWQSDGLCRSPDPIDGIDRSRLFVIDAPPPAVSGSLRMGHAFSSAHTDLLGTQILRTNLITASLFIVPMMT
jgi:valyl-tRNA synthetase